MLEEKVIITIDDYKDQRAVYPLRKAFVKCTFLFKNTTDKEIEATVGFPGNEQTAPGNSSLPVTDFVGEVGRC